MCFSSAMPLRKCLIPAQLSLAAVFEKLVWSRSSSSLAESFIKGIKQWHSLHEAVKRFVLSPLIIETGLGFL